MKIFGFLHFLQRNGQNFSADFGQKQKSAEICAIERFAENNTNLWLCPNKRLIFETHFKDFFTPIINQMM